MDEYLSDEDVVDENFEYDGCPYSFEPENTDEELIERRTRRQETFQFRGQHSHKNMDGVTPDCRGGVARADHDEMLVKLMSFWTINAVLGAALYMPCLLPFIRMSAARFGSKYLPKHCLDQESLLGKPASMISRYPSPAELDAFAQKTANSPLSIKIFPTDVRVPQHKQLNKTVNGLDTTGQRYSPYSHPYSGGYQGLLAIVKASVVVKGVLKNSEGRRTKHTNSQAPVAPYNNPLNNSYTVRHGHKAYHISSCKPPDVPVEAVCSSTGMASGDQSLAPQSELAEVQSRLMMRQMSRVPHSQALQLGGEARSSPSLQAVAAVANSDSDFVLGVPPQSSLAFTGAVIPSQSADGGKAVYVEKGEYTIWQQKHQLQQQQYQQGAGRMYSVRNSAQGHRVADACQPHETCLPLASYRLHPGSLGTTISSSLNCSTMQVEPPVGQFFAPLWDGALATPNSDCYTSQVLATGTCAARPRNQGLSHPHLHQNRHQHHHHHHHHHQPQLHPPLPPPPHSQAYSTDQNLCCGLPSTSLCHAAVLSSSLQSLECLISEIHPPCIKERMLGRGYEAVGMPQLLEHHQQTHIQLPVYR